MSAPIHPPLDTQDARPFSMKTITLERGRVRIAVEGEIDIATSPALNAALLKQLLARRDVELDLTGVAFMDASALGAIIGARRRFERRSQSLLVCLRPSTQPHRLLTLTGILPMLVLNDEDKDGAVREDGRNRDQP